VQPETVATAIRIGDPVSHERARIAIQSTHGVVAEVSDEEILAAKARHRRRGPGLRARLRGQPGRGAQAARGGRHRAGRARRVRPDREHPQGSGSDPGPLAERALTEVDADPAAVEAALAPWLR
jgi:threonine synthase